MSGVVCVVALSHLEGQHKSQVELTITSGGVQAVSTKVFVDILRCSLTQDSVDGEH